MKAILSLIAFVACPAFALGIEPPSKLTPAAQEAASRAFLVYFVNSFNEGVKTGEDFSRFIGAAIPKAQKQELNAYFSSLGPAPRAELDKDKLIFHFKEYDIHVRYPSFAKNQVYIEGMSWAFDTSAPLKSQFDALQAKLKIYSARNNQASNWFFPAAEANVITKIGGKSLERCLAQDSCKWIGAIVGGALLGNLTADTWAGFKTGAYNVACLIGSPAKPWYWGFCFDWKKQWDKAEEYEKARAPAKTDTNNDWIPGQNAQCPRDEKGNEIYDAWIGETAKNADGSWQKKGRWYHFYGKGKDSNLSEAYILSKNQKDASKPEDAEAQFIYTKTEKPALEQIKIKDKSGDWVPILVTDTDSVIPVLQREDNRRFKMIIASAEDWYKTCRKLARGAKIAPEIMEEAVKQMQDQVDKTTTKPEPTAPATN